MTWFCFNCILSAHVSVGNAPPDRRYPCAAGDGQGGNPHDCAEECGAVGVRQVARCDELGENDQAVPRIELYGLHEGDDALNNEEKMRLIWAV